MRVLLGLFSYGGVMEGTHDCVLGELSNASQNQRLMAYSRISGDALISRSRSRAIGKFMESDADVMVMVDHDIVWRPGDAYHVAEAAYKEKALVGGLYCKRAFRKGWSSRVPMQGVLTFGHPGLLESPALATGFMAIPRVVVQGIDDQLDITGAKWKEAFAAAVDAKDYSRVASLQDLSIAPIADGAYREVDFKYKDYFRCIRWPGAGPEIFQYLSEDWAFAFRAVHCGFKSYISTYPILGHIGDHTYGIADGMDEKDIAEVEAHGKNQDNGAANQQNPQPGGNPPGVCERQRDDRRNQSVAPRAFGKAGKRRKR
jgi:hypothetical protein